MKLEILHPDVQEFINLNLEVDVSTLLLKGSPFKSISIKDIVEQIEAKKKCKQKLPTWFSRENIYYPNKLNIEQTSSEITAKYKSQLINGESLIDLTGGLGVDDYYFSKSFKKVTHLEINETLSQIVTHNCKQLLIDNINVCQGDGITYLTSSKQAYEWIYIDPSRRHDSKGKVFFLNDCLPNVPENLDTLFEFSKNIMIKTSPLLDISVGISELQYVKKIHVVALNNEVKELLWILDKNYLGDTTIETINLKKNNSEKFNFILSEEQTEVASTSLPLTYLYEPNSALLKSGAFNSIAKKLNLFKLHKHTHLYTNDVVIPNFPGRQFKIERCIDYTKANVKQLNLKKANITIRNFPEKVSQLRKKFKISDGGNTYLFFATNSIDKKIVIICNKLVSSSSGN